MAHICIFANVFVRFHPVFVESQGEGRGAGVKGKGYISTCVMFGPVLIRFFCSSRLSASALCLMYVLFVVAGLSRLAESPAGWFIDPEALTKHATHLSHFRHTTPPLLPLWTGAHDAIIASTAIANRLRSEHSFVFALRERG